MILIIILNYNKSKETINCIESVLKSNYHDFKILLIDNGSEINDYYQLMKIKNSKIILKRIENNCGYVGGINFGLQMGKELSPEYYLIMNNDTIIAPEAILELVNSSKKYKDNCIVSGKTYNLDEPDTLQYIGQWCKNHNTLNYPSYVKNSKEKDIGQYDNEKEMEMLDDIFWLLPNDVFKKIGYYSEYFYLYGEQNDYAFRAKKKGIKLIYTPGAKIWHHLHLTTADGKKGFQKVYYWQFYATMLLAYFHLSKKYFYLFYVSKLLKLIFISIAYLALLKYSKFKRNHVPKLLAHFYFTKWLFNKKQNNGYNPYSNK
jgi:hypothetical protein